VSAWLLDAIAIVGDALRAIDFGQPWWLLALVLLPLWAWWQRRRRAPQALVFSRAALLARAPHRPSRVTRWATRLRWIALAGLVITLAQPRSGASAQQSTRDGIDIALVIDISSSMLAEDFQPQNRMEVAKERAQAFVTGRRSDRIGVVAFSGEALTQVPLTTDYPVVLAAIENLQPGLLEDGTAIGTAIATAANRLRSADGRSRVMLLLTDGENNRGAIDPRTAAQAATAFGIRLYAIGIGSEGVAPTPVGRGLFGLRYENRPVRIDEALLTEIAEGSGGRYFRARDAAALQRIFEQIDQLERAPVAARSFVRYTERYQWPLAIAVLALLGEVWLLAWRGIVP
jgi:Ca-activated chloride channel family protein